MSLEQLVAFFRLMTIINVGLLILSAVLVMTLKGAVYRLHGWMFGLDEEKVALVSYAYLGILRALVVVFNIVPYVALSLLR